MIRNRKGFTLIELIVTIVIIGILAAFAIPKYLDLVSDSADGTARGVLGNLRSANSLLFASRIIGGTTGTYTWSHIVANAQLQGVNSTYTTDTFEMTAGGYTYVFTLTPTTPAAPNTPATIYCATATW